MCKDACVCKVLNTKMKLSQWSHFRLLELFRCVLRIYMTRCIQLGKGILHVTLVYQTTLRNMACAHICFLNEIINTQIQLDVIILLIIYNVYRRNKISAFIIASCLKYALNILRKSFLKYLRDKLKIHFTIFQGLDISTDRSRQILRDGE